MIDAEAIDAWNRRNKRARDDYRVQPFERIDDNVAAGFHKPPRMSRAHYQARYRARKKEQG